MAATKKNTTKTTPMAEETLRDIESKLLHRHGKLLEISLQSYVPMLIAEIRFLRARVAELEKPKKEDPAE